MHGGLADVAQAVEIA